MNVLCGDLLCCLIAHLHAFRCPQPRLHPFYSSIFVAQHLLNICGHMNACCQQKALIVPPHACLHAEGAQAAIHIDLQGSNRSSGPRMLAPSFSGGPGGLFWRGQIELLLHDLGRLTEAVVGHAKLPKAPGWHLDLVCVEEAATGQVWHVCGCRACSATDCRVDLSKALVMGRFGTVECETHCRHQLLSKPRRQGYVFLQTMPQAFRLNGPEILGCTAAARTLQASGCADVHLQHWLLSG